MQEVDGLRVGEFRALHLAAQDVHLVAGGLPEVRFTQVALEEFRVRQVAAMEAVAGQIGLGEHGSGDGRAAEVEPGKGHLGKGRGDWQPPW